VLEAFRLVLSF